MDAEREERDNPLSSCLSVTSDSSMSLPPNFSQEPDTQEDWSPACVEADRHQERAKSPSRPSLKSDKSMGRLEEFSPGTIEDRTLRPDVTQLSVGGARAKARGNYLDEFPLMIEDWSKEHVKDWLISSLRVPQQIAQKLYDKEMSGACLVSFGKQDLLELGVPPAPAIQIIRQVEKLNSEKRVPKSHHETRAGVDESMETETVSSDSGFESLSSTMLLLQTLRNKIKSVTDVKTTDDRKLHSENTEEATSLHLGKPMCLTRPFDKSDTSFIYTQNDILPPVAGPSNLLDPVHEFQLLPSTKEASEREILYKFTKEIFCFAASCMNSRTNGTIHFGVNSQPGQAHGQVIGHNINSFTKYNEAFELCLREHFEEHTHAARACIRPPKFLKVHCQDGTTSDKWVIEVDVVPTYSETQEKIFYTFLNIASAKKEQHCKTECLFVRDGPRAVNILADPNPRIVQEKMKSMTDKVKCWASARKSAEERHEKHPTQGNQGQMLKQLITHGRDTLENSLHVIAVTNKCHSSQLEHLAFLKEMNLFAVLEFDPESDVDGTCSFYRRDHAANLHYPRMYSTQDSVSTVNGKLNLFKQTSWVFCNGRANEESEMDKPLTPSEWLKKRSGDINNMVSFLGNLLSKDRLLVVFILHSVVTDISSPFMETFCAIYRTLEGDDNMLCICKDFTVFSHWKQLIETRCKVDITNKCIYELSLNEINSTIKKLKEPQTRSSSRYLPSSGSSSVLLTKKDEELMTVLDILSQNECENTEIETNESFRQFKLKTEEDFYRGGQVTWWNFYLSEKPGCLPFIKRDKYDELYDLVTPTERYTSSCVIINLFHQPGCGGTTLAMHVLWNLRTKFRCAIVKNNMAPNREIAVQVTNLLTYGKQEQSGYTPVLLLVDNGDDVEDLKQCILGVASEKKRHGSLMVIILNCERTQFPAESSRNSRIANVSIANKLSLKEQGLFSETQRQLKDYHEKPETFYAFMIMTNNFSENYIKNLVNNILKDLDTTTKQGKLFSFLALLNTYVNGSYISLSLCEELVGIGKAQWMRETLEEKMNPYSTLLINFIVEEHGTYQAVRFLHQMIASNCLQVLSQKHKLSQAEIAINLLHCDSLYKSCMGKDILVQNIQSMLITRHRKEQGDDKDTLFSPLIEHINTEEGLDKIKEVLEKATFRFDKSATLPQALARHFYLKENDFKSALHWAKDAQEKNSNSYIADTVGQVYKSQLKKQTEHPEYLTPDVLDQCFNLAFSAIKAFRDSQELAKKDEVIVQFDLHNRKKKRSYNTSGYVGETEVMMILFEVIQDIPLFSKTDRHKRDKMLQFLNGYTNTFDETSNPTVKQFITVLADHERFLVSLKPRLKEIFSFFESYFTYLKPRSLERETADDRNKHKVSEYFKKYVQIFCTSEKEKASENASNPKMSVHQQVVDQRFYLEVKRADSFAGILQCLNEKSGIEMEHILNKWQFIFDNAPRRYCVSISDTTNFILANIVLHSIKATSKLLKKYEQLVSFLNEALQNEGTHSNCTELYYLSMLLMWPTKDSMFENSATYKNISTYVTSAKKSFHRRFSFMFPARSAIAHFFLGKSNGLKRIVSKGKLDQIVTSASKQQSSCSGPISQPRNHLWQSGAIWKEPEIQKMLLRVKGKSENGDIHVHFPGNLKIHVRPAYLGGIRSGCSQEVVSFYLGFSMEGPVAYDISYENDP